MSATVLVLSPWFPYPADNGSRMRIFNLLKRISQTYEVRLVAGVQDDSPETIPVELADICTEILRIRWIWHDGAKGSALGTARALFSPTPRSILETDNPPLQAAVAAQLALKPEAVLVCELGMDAYLPRIFPSIPFIIDGAEIAGLKSGFQAADASRAGLRAKFMSVKGTRYWQKALRRYNVITAASIGEANALRDLVGADGPNVIVVPNGVDLEAYPRRNEAQIVSSQLIYNGALTYGPNRDAVRFFAREILPRVIEQIPDARLVVTGRYTDGAADDLAANPHLVLTGYLDDLGPTLGASAVCVVPLLSGGGTRLKILEAWGAGVPVVSTTIGAAGLTGAVHGEHLLIADQPADFAAAIIKLLRNPSLAKGLTDRALSLVELNYSWAVTAEGLISAISECLHRLPTSVSH